MGNRSRWEVLGGSDLWCALPGYSADGVRCASGMESISALVCAVA